MTSRLYYELSVSLYKNTTDYVGSFIYQDDQLQSIHTNEGRVVVDGSSYEYQYFLKDHLGNTRITFNSGGIIQEDSYYPYGMNMSGLSESSGIDLPNKYLYNGKELQDDFGLGWYDYGWRFYDPALGRFHTQDRYASDFAGWSPYHYANNNPVLNIDIMGDSTFVSMGENGTYTVTGGNLDNKDDKGVYMMGEDGAYTQVGEYVTSHSFFGDDGGAVVGAIIDPGSTEGQDFIDGLVEDNPGLGEYMVNATNGEKYDLKDQGKDDRAEGTTEQQYRYRGSTSENGEFDSARDFGNMGAGIVAGRKGLSWGIARTGFDAYQSYKSGKLTKEGPTTQKAQRVGHKMGRAMFVKEELSRLPGNGHLRK